MKKALKIIGFSCVAVIIIIGLCMAIPPKTLDFRGSVTEIEVLDNETVFHISDLSIGTYYIVVADDNTNIKRCHKDDPQISLSEIKIGDTIEGNYRWFAKDNKAKFITVWFDN